MSVVRQACLHDPCKTLHLLLKWWQHLQTRKTQAQKDLEERTAKRRAKRLKRKVRPLMSRHRKPFGRSCYHAQHSCSISNRGRGSDMHTHYSGPMIDIITLIERQTRLQKKL